MAVTVEELQILLSCDASQAEKVLDKITKMSDSAAKKLSKATSSADKKITGGGSNGKQAARQHDYYNRIAQGIDKATAAQKRLNREFSKKSSNLSFRDVARGKGFDAMLAEQCKDVEDAAKKIEDATKKQAERLANIPIHQEQTQSAYVDKNPNKTPYYQTEGGKQAAREQARNFAEWERSPYGGSEVSNESSTVEKLKNDLDEATRKASEFAAQWESAMKRLQFGKASNLKQEINETLAEIDFLKNSIDALEGKDTSQPAIGIKETGEEAEKAAPKVERYNRALSKGQKGGSAFGKVVNWFGKSFKKNNGFLSRFGATVKRVIMRMMAMALVRGVINSITQGMQILGNASSSAEKKFAKFTALGNSVKAALGSVALSVLNALAPILYNIASAAITAANAISRFIAALSGGTYFAVSLADSFEGVESSAKGAGSAAKGALAAFDELNVIGNKGGGGGGGSSTDIGNTEIAEKKAESVLANLLKGGQFVEAGSYVADILKGISDNVWKFFDDLDKKQYGKKFAKFLNGVFGNTSAFQSVGKTVGKGVNLVVNTLYDVFKTFDARNAAGSLAELLNKAFAEIDWIKMGASVALFLLDAIEFAVNFVKNINWGQVVKSVIDLIFGFLKDLLSNPQRLVRLIKDVAMMAINALGGLIMGGIAGIVDGLSIFFPQLKGIGQQITDEWDSTMKNLDAILDGEIDKMSTSWVSMGDTAVEASDNTTDGLSEQREMLVSLTKESDKYNASLGRNPYNSTKPTVTTTVKEYGKTVKEAGEYISIMGRNMNLFAQDDYMPTARTTADNYTKSLGTANTGITNVTSSTNKLNASQTTSQKSAKDMVAEIAKIPLKTIQDANAAENTFNNWLNWNSGSAKTLNADVSKLPKKPIADASTAMSGLKTSLDSAKTSQNNLTTAVNSFNGSKAGSAMSDAFSNAASKVTTVKDKLKQLSDGLNNLPENKTVNIKLKATVSTTGSGGTTVNKPTVTVNLAMAEGGIAYGETLARIGEYANARVDPEVVAPLSKLQNILEKSNTGGGKATEQSMREQNQLLRDCNNTLLQILRKEFRLSPSSELGQVVDRSLVMYART